MACGVGLGLIALAREGISVAVLRRMQDDEEDDDPESVVDEVEELIEDLESESAREGAPLSR